MTTKPSEPDNVGAYMKRLDGARIEFWKALYEWVPLYDSAAAGLPS